MAFSESRSELIMELAEEFLERYRKGEKPPLKEYIDRHPELAAEIKDVFPAMAMMENIAVADDSMEERQAPTVSATPEISFKQLGDYRIIREIGHGGMGVVYEAEQVSLGRHVALKVLANQTLKDAKHKRRFEREARAAAKLHHTNIVPVFGVGEHDGLPYYVMQFIQGLGLDAVLDELKKIQTGTAPTGSPAGGELRISRRDVSAADMARSLLTGAFQQSADGEAGDPKPDPAFAATLDQPGDSLRSAASPAQADSQPLSDTFTLSSSSIILPGTSSTGRKADAKKQTYWQSVANIGRQIADALEYAHKQGVQHRDVKPSNLLLDLRGTVWVTDFGLAKVAGPGAEDLTHTGDILGTLRYMPPEAFEGKTDARSDVYALGLTLYELLAMKPAFNERDRNKLIKQVTSGEPTPLDQVRREVPRDLVTIIQKSIAREPSRRYATAEELAADLQRFLDDEPILARRQTRRERYVRWARHNPGIAVLGGVLTAVLVLVTIASLLVAGHFSRSAQREREARQAESSQRQIAEETAQQAKALGLVQLILNVDTSKVLPYVAQLPEHRQWSDPLLREVFDQAADKSQQKLHAGLALLPVDPGQVDYLLGRLLDADPQVELAVIRDALAPQKDRLLDRLWAVAEKPQQGYDAQRLRAAAALAKYDPDSERWVNRRVDTVVFLSSLQETSARGEGDWFRKDGTTVEGVPIVVDGVAHPHSLFTHAPPDGRTASVSYNLDASCTQFLARVGIPAVRIGQRDPESPLVFEVVGNGKSLWKSTPLARRGEFQDCRVALAGIRRLELRVTSPGPSNWGWATWLDARLTCEPRMQDIVVNDLIAVPAGQLTAWKEAFRPMRLKLLMPLSAVLRGRDGSEQERTQASEIFADYAADQPELLADLLMDTDDKQFAVIYPKFKEHPERGLPILISECRKETPASPASPRASDWTVRFYKWEANEQNQPADWEAVLQSPILDELKMPRLYFANLNHNETPPTPRVPGRYFAAVATTEATLGDGDYRINAAADDSLRVWLDNELVIDWLSPTTSHTVRHKPGRHLIKVEYRQVTGPYALDVDVVSEEKETLAKRQANAGVALLRMNQLEKVWPLLQHSSYPNARSNLIHRLSQGANAAAIVKQLDKELDLTIRRALVLSLNEFNDKQFSPDDRKALGPKLKDIYRSEPDPGLHAAAEWLLRQWKEEAWLKETDRAWAQGKVKGGGWRVEGEGRSVVPPPSTLHPPPGWYVNGQGQTLVVVPGPVEFWMGSPPTEEGRERGPEGTNEFRHWQRIGRSFAIASKEVTVEQFLRFRMDHSIDKGIAQSNDCPANKVSWYDAAAYCNWLSEQEGMPKDQWCYEPNETGEYAQGMKMAPNYLQRTGYRLPTEAEWEFSCRAGAVARYSFGESEELLPKYAWYRDNSQNKTWPVGSLKPNDLGLFDMHGNAFEWCQDSQKLYGADGNGRATEDLEDLAEITDSRRRILRGGSEWHPSSFARSADRYSEMPTDRNGIFGFRPARTLPFRSFDRYAAARAASLTAADHGKDKLDNAAKTKLRQQALTWLNAEFADWNKVQPTPRQAIVRTLWLWQHDSALASIRDTAALAKLPAKEQTAFIQFWSDVAKTVEPANGAERIECARMAVLIAVEQGKDEPAFDDATKASLRGQALTWLKAELPVTADRAGKARIIAAAAPLPGLLDQLSVDAPNDGRFQVELARHYADRGNAPLAKSARTKARAQFEAQLAKEPENAILAADLADLLLIDTRWSVLKPTEMKAEGSASLRILEDDSVLVSGPVPPQDVYTLIFRNPPARIQQLRLEVLPHESLPNNGPGSNGNGNFVLTTVKAQLDLPKDKSEARSLKLARAFTDFSQNDFSVDGAIDANDSTGWAIQPEEGKRHFALFELAEPVTETAGTVLRVTLEFKSGHERHNLGRFRLSASGEPANFYREQKRLTLPKFTDPWSELAAAYALNGRNDKAVEYYAKALQANPKPGDERRSQIRYVAACTAILAAGGQGKDEPPLDAMAKAKFRRQALDSLRADLTDWSKVQPVPRQAIVRILWLWRQDSALAGIRDAKALEKLSPDEREAFAQLWAEVEALFKELTPKRVIIKAEYGAGRNQWDVTELLQKLVTDEPLITLPRPTYVESFGGDPAYGVVKQLKIRYALNGKVGEVSFSENEPILLPAPKDTEDPKGKEDR